MVKIKIASILVVSVLILTSCYEGYTSSEGSHLKKYLSPSAMKELLENDSREITVIDVRPSAAYEKGHLPGAISIPSSDVKERLGDISKNRDAILYCETGGRAQKVISFLEEQGYTRLMNWGGYTRWEWGYTTGVSPDDSGNVHPSHSKAAG